MSLSHRGSESPIEPGRRIRFLLSQLGSPLDAVGEALVIEGRQVADVAAEWAGPLTAVQAEAVVHVTTVFTLLFTDRGTWRSGLQRAFCQTLQALPVPLRQVALDVVVHGKTSSSAAILAGTRLDDLHPGLSRFFVEACLAIILRLIMDRWGFRPATDLQASSETRQVLELVASGRGFHQAATATGVEHERVTALAQMFAWSLAYTDDEGRPLV